MTAGAQRLFFALWPPRDVARRIATQADALGIGGRRVALPRLHMTLAFVGACDSAQTDALRDNAASIRAPAFDLVLDQLGHFARPGITWFGCTTAPDPLLALAAGLAPADVDNRAFRPHVSVVHDSVPMATRLIDPIVWRVTAFALIASGQATVAGAYRELDRWALA